MYEIVGRGNVHQVYARALARRLSAVAHGFAEPGETFPFLFGQVLMQCTATPNRMRHRPRYFERRTRDVDLITVAGKKREREKEKWLPGDATGDR